MKESLVFIWEIAKIVIIAALIVAPIRYFLFQPFVVHGSSMEPTFEAWDYLIIDEISYDFRQPERGEVVIFKYPLNKDKRFIKRIVGLPGETIKINEGQVIIISDGQKKKLQEKYLPSSVSTAGNTKITLDSDEYFVLGDNRHPGGSSDSRKWGPLKEDLIVGRLCFHLDTHLIADKLNSTN